MPRIGLWFNMRARMGIAIGDVSGVGPEVTLKALATKSASDDSSYLLIGDLPYLERLAKTLSLKIPLTPLGIAKTGDRYAVFNPFAESFPEKMEGGSLLAARAAVAYLREGAKRCLAGELAGLVTAPVNKESIIRSGEPFVGQTELLSQIAGTGRTAMMLMGHDDRGRWLRVVLATTHIAISKVSEKLTGPAIMLAIEMAGKACTDLCLGKSRIAVCGLNPHAGEGGKMGTEEITTITPAVEEMKKKGFDVHGPFAADALFHKVFKGDYEIVVAMYHDQGLAPLKMIAFESGINWTLGLPFIRTSPDHGTAYDIAGLGIANPSSMIAAIDLAHQLSRS